MLSAPALRQHPHPGVSCPVMQVVCLRVYLTNIFHQGGNATEMPHFFNSHGTPLPSYTMLSHKCTSTCRQLGRGSTWRRRPYSPEHALIPTGFKLKQQPPLLNEFFFNCLTSSLTYSVIRKHFLPLLFCI